MTTPAFARCLEVLAVSPSGYEAPRSERAAIDELCGTGAAAYGELEPEGARRLFQALRLGPDDVFVDLGSGIGTLPLLAAAVTPVRRAVGIELSAFRHGVATRNLRILSRDTDLGSRVELRRGDLRFANLDDATVVYAGATLFPDALRAAMCRQVETAAPRLRALVSTRELPPPFDRVFPQRAELDLPTTWAPRVRVVIHDPPRRATPPRDDRVLQTAD